MNKINNRLLTKSFAISALINIGLFLLSYSFLIHFTVNKKPLEVVLLASNTKSSYINDAYLAKKTNQMLHRQNHAIIQNNEAPHKYIEKKLVAQKSTFLSKSQTHANPEPNFLDNTDQTQSIQTVDNNQPINKHDVDQSYDSKAKQNVSMKDNVSQSISMQDYAFLRKLIEKNLEYPYLARRNSYQGTVVVSFIIDNGVFKDISVAKSSGYAILDKAALEAVKKIEHYVNISKNVKIVVPINFMINTQ